MDPCLRRDDILRVNVACDEGKSGLLKDQQRERKGASTKPAASRLQDQSNG
jgi:hypothetical protein